MIERHFRQLRPAARWLPALLAVVVALLLGTQPAAGSQNSPLTGVPRYPYDAQPGVVAPVSATSQRTSPSVTVLEPIQGGATTHLTWASYNYDCIPSVVAGLSDQPPPGGSAASMRRCQATTQLADSGLPSSGVAAKAEVPLIKAGSAGGETAGKAFPQAVKDAALAENPSNCVYCRMETDAPQVDHVIPRVRGGNATLDNAQTTCGWCNPSKGARDFPVNPPGSAAGIGDRLG